MAIAPPKTDFFSVPLAQLRTASVLGFDIYISHFDGEPVLYRSRDLEFTVANRQRLRESGIDDVLVLESQREPFDRYVGGREDPAAVVLPLELEAVDDIGLEVVISDLSRPLVERCEKLLSVTRDLVEHALSDLSTTGLPERLQRVAESTARFLLAEPAAYSRMVETFQLDFATYNHSTHTALYTLELARAAGINNPEELAQLGRAALLHDVGKGDIPSAILHKEAPLDDLEWAEVMTHPDRGVAMLEEHGWDDPVALEVCGLHHERWDGSGYTHGLVGEQIPLPARMVAITDVFDALTSCYPYRPALTGFQALWKMKREMNGQFDPELLDLFVEVMTLPAARK